MSSSSWPARAAGLFFTRALLGIILLMQGFGKIFIYTINQVYEMFFKPFEATFLPKVIVMATAYFTTYAELMGGLLLILGLFRKYAMYAIALDLLIVSFGHGLLEPIWDLQHVIPRAILLIALFLLPQEWDIWSIDVQLDKRKKS